MRQLQQETAHAAMKVAGVDAKQEPAEETEDRIAEIAMQFRHGAALDTALEAVTHYQVGSIAYPLDEDVESGKIIGIICIAHDDDEATARSPHGRRIPIERANLCFSTLCSLTSHTQLGSCASASMRAAASLIISANARIGSRHLSS